jgi:hypothetical protein
MLYVRTASGSFINAATITRLLPRRVGDDEITGWVAYCRDGEAVSLASYYALPGRIDAVLDHLPPSSQAAGAVENDSVLPCSSENCPCA